MSKILLQLLLIIIPWNENKRQTNIRPCQITKKLVEHEQDNDNNCSWCTWNGSQMLGKGSGTNKNQRKNWEHSDNSILVIGQNTPESWRSKEPFCYSVSKERLPANIGVKKLARGKGGRKRTSQHWRLLTHKFHWYNDLRTT